MHLTPSLVAELAAEHPTPGQSLTDALAHAFAEAVAE